MAELKVGSSGGLLSCDAV